MSAERDDCKALAQAAPSLTATPVEHHRFVEAEAALEEARGNFRLILLTGPTGVGKGRLVETVAEKLNRSVADESRLVRAAVVRTLSPTQNRFPWRDQSIRILEALEDPLPGRKLDRAAAAARLCPALRGCNSSLPSVRHARSSDDTLRRAIRDAAHDRGLELLVFDEAFNLVNGVRARRLAQQLDVLRDLGDQASFRIVLVSTERIVVNLDLSSELARRTGFVYFPRYGAQVDVYGQVASSRSARREFASAAVTFMGRLPVSSRLELTKEQHRFLFDGTCGCVGRLVDWFVRAVNKCLRDGASCLEWEHFLASSEADETLRKFRRTCREHERRVAEDRARSRLGSAGCRSDIPVEQEPLFADEPGNAAGRAAPSGRIGTPDPTRHAEAVAQSAASS